MTTDCICIAVFPRYTTAIELFFLQYVVVSSKKILFYNDEQDKEQSNPSMVLDIE